MKTVRLFLLSLMVLSVSFGATVESARAHSAAGSFGCTVSGVSVATPAVVTCAAAHNLVDGDQVQITGVGGTTTVNTTGYAKVTSYSATTFGFFSDHDLTAGITGTGAYTSGGKVSMAFDISGLSADFTIKFRIEGLTSGKKALVYVQDSADGFVSDVATLLVVNVTGSAPPMNAYTVRGYQLPSARFGVTNGRLRVFVQSLDSSTTVTTTLLVE